LLGSIREFNVNNGFPGAKSTKSEVNNHLPEFCHFIIKNQPDLVFLRFVSVDTSKMIPIPPTETRLDQRVEPTHPWISHNNDGTVPGARATAGISVIGSQTDFLTYLFFG
jgi:hypothetical protein